MPSVLLRKPDSVCFCYRQVSFLFSFESSQRDTEHLAIVSWWLIGPIVWRKIWALASHWIWLADDFILPGRVQDLFYRCSASLPVWAPKWDSAAAEQTPGTPYFILSEFIMELGMRNGAVEFILEQDSGLSHHAPYDRTRHIPKERALAASQPQSLPSSQNVVWMYESVGTHLSMVLHVSLFIIISPTPNFKANLPQKSGKPMGK